MPRAPGASPPRRSSCRRSQFPCSPWRWPNPPPAAKHPSHYPRFAVYPPTQPRATQEAGRSPSDRPFPWAKPKTHARKRRRFRRLRSLREEPLVGLRAVLVVAGAARLAGIAERRRDGREIARARRDRKLVVGGVDILARGLEA